MHEKYSHIIRYLLIYLSTYRQGVSEVSFLESSCHLLPTSLTRQR